MYKVQNPTTAQCIFLSGTHGTFAKIVHILNLKLGVNKYQRSDLNKDL